MGAAGTASEPPYRLGAAELDGEQVLVAGCRDRAVPLRALPGCAAAPSELIELIERWEHWGPLLDAATAGELPPGLDPARLGWLPPVRPRKLICVGSNYADHVAEMRGVAAGEVDAPPFPYGFLKPASTALVGSGALVALPAYARAVDWEGELAVVMAGDPRRLVDGDPLDAVFGYSVLNDLSVRDFIPFPHALGLDTVVAKGFDGSAPMGPWVTPARFVGDPQRLSLELSVNGEPRQRSSTGSMIFGVRTLVEHFARVLTLEAGDVLATGTPAGVGARCDPPEFLQDGDEVAVRIERLGELRTPIGAPAGERSSLEIHTNGGAR